MPLNIRIGFFLATRALRRASLWTTGLIIGVMVLTFLNLVVVSGILVGLLQGAVDAVRTQYTSDVIISSLNDKKYIENSPNLISLISTLPEVGAYTARYREAGLPLPIISPRVTGPGARRAAVDAIRACAPVPS